MNNSFELFPESASSVSGRVDALYAFLVLTAVFFTVLICALILYFGIRYRRGSKANRKNPPKSVLLEVAWAVIPLVLTMVMFGWGAVVYYDMRTPPPEAMEIEVVGKQWMWKLQHPQGKTEINTLHLPVGQPVKLRMISEDVIHSFYIPAFRVKQDVLPGSYTSLWFKPTKTGTYHLFCAEYCGTKHSEMGGWIVAMEPAAFQAWLQGGAGELSIAAAGERKFQELGCVTCHRADTAGRGPNLQGLFGRPVRLADGGTITADEGYIRESIVNPAARIVAGYQPIMPAYQGLVTEESLMHLVAYVQSLGGSPAAQGGEAVPSAEPAPARTPSAAPAPEGRQP
jgi:cytochrome c oxidase subunit 2